MQLPAIWPRIRAWTIASWPVLAAAAFGIFVFVELGGARTIVPTDTSWIPPGSDWGYHWVGWIFFRDADWSYPIGATPNLFHPVGTTVGFMDGIPWLAVVMKVLSPILPSSWQHIGLWLTACFVLQGWFGARLTAVFTDSKPAAALGGALLTLAPVLTHRLQHEALCAHWLILWALTLHFRRAETPPRYGHVVLPAVAIGIHPYLAAMVYAIVLSSLVGDLWMRRIPWQGVLWRAAAGIASILVLATLFGYFTAGFDALQAKGFGRFNAEMLALVNPRGDSRVLADYAIRNGQEEGYGYVGLGVLVLAFSSLPVAAWAAYRRAPALPWKRIAPFALAVALCTLFAFGAKLTAHGTIYKELTSTYEHLGRLRGTFRASGRFIWVASYAVTVGAMALWLVRLPRWAPYALAVALLVQMIDLKDWRDDHFDGAGPAPPQSPTWALARGDYDHMALYPPRCGDPNGPCCAGFTTLPKANDMYLAALAARLHLTYNGFGAARVARAELAPWCQRFDADILAGRLDPRTIYVVSRKKEPAFVHANPTAICGRPDREMVCVSADATGPFRDALAE